MLKNFVNTALRNLYKNKLISFINIFGLSLAIGCSVVIYITIAFQSSIDQFHEYKEETFLVMNVVARDGAKQLWGDSPAPIAQALKSDFPQIKRVVRVDNRRAIFKYEDKVFTEGVRFVDSGFLDMFTFPLELGTKEVLIDPSKIIISKRTADKYFGEKDPMGEQVELIINDQKASFVIGGVAKQFPKAASFGFDILINFEKKFDMNEEKIDATDWTKFVAATFIQLNNPNDISLISSQMDKYVAIQNAVEKDWPASAYLFEPVSTLSRNSYQIRGDISGGDDPTGRMVLSIIGVFMMTLACFNYINISIASAARRLKEIGVRKSIGGTRQQLIFQFIGENLIICLFALVLGAIWARTIFGPWLDNLFSIGLDLDFYKNIKVWGFFLVLLIITGLGSGAYPAFYISSFKAVSILRGKEKFGTKNRFTRIFLTFQFILSIITIVFGIAFIQNEKFQQNIDWGYNQQQTLVLPLAEERAYTALKNDFIQHPDVISVAGTQNHIGRSLGLSVVDVNGEKFEIQRIDAGQRYLETLGVRLKEGRFFDENLATDKTESVVVNNTMVRNMGWEKPVGQRFDIDTLTYNVIGVVEDFHYNNFFEEIEPTFFRLTEQSNFNFMAVRIREGKATQFADYAQSSWKKQVPDLPYNGFFQDEVFDGYFNQVKGHGKIMTATASLAVILSCIGLFGLVSLNVTAKMREFSIRKVLGAGLISIFNGINRQYVWLISIACIIGLPISYLMVQTLFDQIYKYHMPLTVIPLILAAILIFSMALLTISSQIYKVMRYNPVDSLRAE